MEQLVKRQADDEAEELRKKEHNAKSRKTEGDISSAKERFLARKKAAAEAAAKQAIASAAETNGPLSDAHRLKIEIDAYLDELITLFEAES